MRAPATRFPPANFSTCAKAHVRLLYIVYIDIYTEEFQPVSTGREREEGGGGEEAAERGGELG